MPTIIFLPTERVQQVDDFPANCTRTQEGALYVRPGGTLVVSDQEALHLRSKGIKFSVSGRVAKATPGTAPTDPAPADRPAPKPLPGLAASPIGGGQLGGSQGEPEQK